MQLRQGTQLAVAGGSLMLATAWPPAVGLSASLQTIQLYEMVVVRHGLMIVGLPFSGKTASYKMLAQALGLMEQRMQENQQVRA